METELKKKNTKKTKMILLIITILVLGSVGVTLAYFTSQSTFTNLFKTELYSTEFTEEFSSPNDWKPGDTTIKEVVVKNTGNVDVAVCVSYTEEWLDKNGNTLANTNNGESVAILNLANQRDWIKHNNKYLYHSKLAKNEETTSFLESVTFNPNVFSQESCTTEGNKVVCNTTGDEYMGGTYTLSVLIETVQWDGRSEVCGGDIEEIIANQPRAVFKPGPDVNSKMKTLAAGRTKAYDAIDQIITDIIRVYEIPNNITVTSDNEVQTDESTTPIYMWYNDQVINWYTEDPYPEFNPDTSYFYNELEKLNTIQGIDTIITDNVLDMSYMFYYTGSRSSEFMLDLGKYFDTSNVTNMKAMFRSTGSGSTVFTLDLGSLFDTSKVTNMETMFTSVGYNSPVFTLDLGDKFDTSKVTNMKSMFAYAGYYSQIFTLNLGSNFDTSNVTNMQSMFNITGYNSPVFTLNLGLKFDTSKVTNMYAMFYRTGYQSNVFLIDLGPKFSIEAMTDDRDIFGTIEYYNSNFKIYVSNSTIQSWAISKVPTKLSTSNVIIKNYN